MCTPDATRGGALRGGGGADTANGLGDGGGGGGGGWYGGGGGACIGSTTLGDGGGGGGSGYTDGDGVSDADTKQGGGGAGGGSQEAGKTGSVVLQWVGPADLSTEKTVSPSTPVRPGDTFEFTITTTNGGTDLARNVQAVDELPDGLTFVASDDACAADGQEVTCGPEATLADGAETSWTFEVKLAEDYVGDGSDLANTATSESDNPDPDEDNNTSDPVTPPVVDMADLSTTKVPTTSTRIKPGDTFEYKVTVANAGPSDAEDVEISDQLPEQLSFESSADGCSEADGKVSCGPEATVAAGSEKSWTFKVRLDPDYEGDGSDIANTATAESSTLDPDDGNNTSDEAGLPGDKIHPKPPWKAECTVVEPGMVDCSGKGTPGNKVVVRDKTGAKVCQTEVKEDGSWDCSGPARKGPLTAIQINPEGLTSEPVTIPLTGDLFPPDKDK
nr:DUF11 domain-containing protein [Streptomyces coryli]